MTTDMLRVVHQAQPFEPFVIHMADGRTFPIPHREFLSYHPASRVAVVFHADGSLSILDLLLMTELRVVARTVSPNGSTP